MLIRVRICGGGDVGERGRMHERRTVRKDEGGERKAPERASKRF